jgi:hypothetical protein
MSVCSGKRKTARMERRPKRTSTTSQARSAPETGVSLTRFPFTPSKPDVQDARRAVDSVLAQDL